MRLLNILKRSSFFSSIAMLTTGSFFAQLIVVLCSILITRLYSVSEIGIYSYFLVISTTFTAILNFRYDMAIVSEENEENIFPLIKLSLLIGTVISILVTFAFGIYFWFFKPEYSSYRYIIPFFFFLMFSNTIINVITAYNNRIREYGVLSKVTVIRSICQNVGGIILGFLKLGVLGLILPYTIGQYCCIRMQSKTLFPSLRRIMCINRTMLKKVALKHKNLPLFSVPAMFANSLSYASVTVFLEMLFDMEVVGLYSLSTRILGLPLALISGNVSKVFMQEASVEYAKGIGFEKAYKKTLSFLTVIAIPMGILIYFLAPLACGFFLGEKWLVAGEYIQILIPYYMLRFIGTALSPGLIVCKKQKREFLIQVLLVLTSIISYIFTIFTIQTVDTFLWFICVSKSLVYVFLIYSLWRESNNNKVYTSYCS